ncbi:hypothetical protein B0H13DRAFT_2348547 [Mycena leptocephala]|nr:hypothetical protein B0H13DRAFT_2348547 [Mycena leptocephala]
MRGAWCSKGVGEKAEMDLPVIPWITSDEATSALEQHELRHDATNTVSRLPVSRLTFGWKDFGRTNHLLPSFFPDPGVNRFTHTGEFYIVRTGKVAAIFTSRERAEDMTRGVLGSNLVTAPTWGDAIDAWTAYCIVVHQRTGPCHHSDPGRSLLWGVKGLHCTFTSKKEAREAIPVCTPTTFSHGKNLTNHDNDAMSQYWCVCKGHTPGIYLDYTVADQQIHHFSNNLWRVFDTHAEALAFWRRFCLEEHDHTAREYKVKGVAGTFKNYDDAINAAAAAFIFAV